MRSVRQTDLREARRRRNDLLEKTRYERAGKGLRVDCSLSCIVFYAGMFVVATVVPMYIFGIGPFKPKYKIFAREASSVFSATDPPFVIHVYPAAEDMYISAQVQRTGVWEGDLERRIRRLMMPYEDATFLDVGAHIGFHALSVASVGHKVCPLCHSHVSAHIYIRAISNKES
jgi:hypothetical protein